MTNNNALHVLDVAHGVREFINHAALKVVLGIVELDLWSADWLSVLVAKNLDENVGISASKLDIRGMDCDLVHCSVCVCIDVSHIQHALDQPILLSLVEPALAGEEVALASGVIPNFHMVQVPAWASAMVVMPDLDLLELPKALLLLQQECVHLGPLKVVLGAIQLLRRAPHLFAITLTTQGDGHIGVRPCALDITGHDCNSV
mmetsp:Transcript_16787/g.43885  ORF Transcript_16787/g.43885 Transcript_16787/m.43885 type:complete len:203 (+) Transcript_16787:7113-7721(+)